MDYLPHCGRGGRGRCPGGGRNVKETTQESTFYLLFSLEHVERITSLVLLATNILEGVGALSLKVPGKQEPHAKNVHPQEKNMMMIQLQIGFIVQRDLAEAELILIGCVDHVDHVDEEKGQHEVNKVNGLAEEARPLLEKTQQAYEIQKEKRKI